MAATDTSILAANGRRNIIPAPPAPPPSTATGKTSQVGGEWTQRRRPQATPPPPPPPIQIPATTLQEHVFDALRTRAAYLPGGCDRDGKMLVVVCIQNDLAVWNRKCLSLSIAYLKRALGSKQLQRGVTVIVDAQRSSSRITRSHARIIYGLFGEVPVNLYLVRAECFWEKHVEPCTKSHTKGEAIILPRARLSKYFDMCQLPEELGGTMQFNYDLWLQQRKAIDEFDHTYEQVLDGMKQLHILLGAQKSLRPPEMEGDMKQCTQLYASVQGSIEGIVEMGNRVLSRLSEVYSPLPASMPSSLLPTATSTPLPATPPSLSSPSGGGGGMSLKPRLPPDLAGERTRLELCLNDVELRQTELRTAWLELLHSIRESRELANFEEGVSHVTNWILNTGEQRLSQQVAIGSDVRSSESLRNSHNVLELECRETYALYAELLYKMDTYEAIASRADSVGFRALEPQKEFMQFICRAFAMRIERRRNTLITANRFYRLVSEYFDRTTEVFETLIMGREDEGQQVVSDTSEGSEATSKESTTMLNHNAAQRLRELIESQQTLANIERELVREGEKLSDMLAMPVKDALGRDQHVDYSGDIANIRDILTTTKARRSIFSDSVELQKITLQQLSHIQAYELDARIAIKWMNDLYDVMVRCHSHVGSNIHEIQVQKDELQAFQETGKSIYTYGSQLLEASQALRLSCQLSTEPAMEMSHSLERTWQSLQAISQEHMTRLRVSAVFHRSVEEYVEQLRELTIIVRRLAREHQEQRKREIHQEGALQEDEDDEQQQRLLQCSSSSGISSEECDSPNPMKVATSTTTSATLSPTRGMLKEGLLRKTTPTMLLSPSQRSQLRAQLLRREQLLVEVGRMVRLGRLLKTRLKEPFVLDAISGKSVALEDLSGAESPVDSGSGTPDADRLAEEATAASSSSPSTIGIAESEAGSTTTTATTATTVVEPTGKNAIACNAISQKLNEIAEVAESLDTAIRDIQGTGATSTSAEDEAMQQRNTTLTPSLKNASNDQNWQSRSIEDESFATASDGAFTIRSSASGARTASFVSCNKDSSFEASEADDSTFAFDMPEMTSPLNESYASSEHSFLSAQQGIQSPSSMAGAVGGAPLAFHDDQSSEADVEELRSQSVTPTPRDHEEEDRDYTNGIPIVSESENELESCIADAPSMEILTELEPLASSHTPEVSTHSNAHGSINAGGVGGTNKPPNAAWRRSKYYENITKHSIKGFL